MQLIGAHITNYRSVEDSGRFTIEPDVTCLVGKNESGKTAVLQSIYRCNPVESSKRFDEVVDFPARLTSKRKQWKADERIPVVQLTFRFDDGEIEKIEEDLGVGVLESPEFTVTAGYRNEARTFDLKINEGVVVEHLRKPLDLPSAGAAAVGAATTIPELLAALENLEDATSGSSAIVQRIRDWRRSSLMLHIVDQYASAWMPRFVYFDDYDIMCGKVSIPDLIRRRDADSLSRRDRALLSLLNMASVDLRDFQTTDRHERLIRELENSSNVISDEVFEYWSQNDQLEVQLEILQPEQDAQPPLNEGPILQVRVLNRRHRASVPFDERSRGFVWFFSFLAYFTELEEAAEQDLILLLDEPGLSLHGRAQEDLLRLIDERLAPKHQVLYTTHSPFLVSADHLHRVRTVIDQDKVGTKVSAEIFKADEDTIFPLLTAMGIEMTQTMFIGEHNLLLEGPSDLIYLDVLTDVVESTGGAGLDPHWVKIPVGGAGKLSTFVSLLGANRLNIAVLADSSTKDVGAIRRLRDNGQLRANGLIQVSEFVGTGDADIEDLFETDFYLELVNKAYSKELSSRITSADLNPRDPRIVRQIEGYFQQHGLGKFNHYKPAALLLREQAALLQKISSVTVSRATQLFARLNSLLT
ncbi:ATP-dependent nuclease [Microbispora hainanensis]|uniref:AAA family ATPase n=1 Tax=Microbispora hainanensis TaxID=568844 RepID=A0A544YSL1_9ACTN|nr:AAA family ATPase [Microbispora hainanensis]TQS19748.1 AAA family ATPase [Microbispora hainanensis]